MTDTGGIAADHLRSFVERIERLTEEIKALNSDKADVFKEAKGAGFDVPALKALIKERAMDPTDLDEAQSILDLYRRAISGALTHTHEGHP